MPLYLRFDLKIDLKGMTENFGIYLHHVSMFLGKHI